MNIDILENSKQLPVAEKADVIVIGSDPARISTIITASDSCFLYEPNTRRASTKTKRTPINIS